MIWRKLMYTDVLLSSLNVFFNSHQMLIQELKSFNLSSVGTVFKHQILTSKEATRTELKKKL